MGKAGTARNDSLTAKRVKALFPKYRISRNRRRSDNAVFHQALNNS